MVSDTGDSAAKTPFGVRNAILTCSRRSFAGMGYPLLTANLQQFTCQRIGDGTPRGSGI
jgi:hypothetical protein